MLWSSPCSAHADKHCTPDSIWPTDRLPQWTNHIYLFCKTLLLPPRVTARVSSSNKWRCCVKKLEVILVEDIYPVSSRRSIRRRVPAMPWWVHSSTSYSKKNKEFWSGEKNLLTISQLQQHINDCSMHQFSSARKLFWHSPEEHGIVMTWRKQEK
jgi:hypothetical protein